MDSSAPVDRAMLWLLAAAGAAALVVGAFTGFGAVADSPGGYAVRVTVDGDTVKLVPRDVPAGDIYLELVGPGTAAVIVHRVPGPEGRTRPLSIDDVNLVAHGCTSGVIVTRGFANGGIRGNVTRLALSPGSYVVLPDQPEALYARSGGVIASEPVAILEVRP